MSSSKWYLIMSKPHKDAYAEEQLSNQGYTVYRPLISLKKKVRGKLKQVEESLFPRYLFIELKAGVDNWSSIRSTKGVLNIVRFGITPAEVPGSLIQFLKDNENACGEAAVDLNRFTSGEKVLIDSGPFAGLEAVFERYQGDERVIVLLNILNNVAVVNLSATEIDKVA